MKKLSIIAFMFLLASCEYIGNNSTEIKTLNRELDSLTRVRDSLLIEEKKLDSPVIFFYYYRAVNDKENVGIFWSSQIYHAGEFLKGPFDEGEKNRETIVEVLTEGRRAKKLKP